MGGSGDGGRYRISETELSKVRDEARQRLDRSRSDAAINSYLQGELLDINDRDIEATNLRLDEIEAALDDEVDKFDRLLFGGSVAKHTHVNGLSDVDCLVVFDAQSVQGENPAEVLADLAAILERNLDMSDVQNISIGRMAVTVTYGDNSQIQLLPATDDGESQRIPAAGGDDWSAIRPRLFSEAFTKVNSDQGGAVVPAVKLAKAILANRLPEENRLSGYHIEALALVAFREYDGPRTPKAMVERFFDSARSSVLKPIRDITGQSRHVDESLGGENSAARIALSQELNSLSRQTEKAGSVADWQALLGD